MEWIKRLEPFWLALVVIGGLNWACIALFETNVMSEVLGTGGVLDVAYVLVGLGALMLVPVLMDRMHLGGLHRPHHGH